MGEVLVRLRPAEPVQVEETRGRREVVRESPYWEVLPVVVRLVEGLDYVVLRDREVGLVAFEVREGVFPKERHVEVLHRRP